MLTVNIHDAKTRLSELIARAVAGEPFIIAKAGKPMVKVEALAAGEAKPRSIIGCMKGQITLPAHGLPEALTPEEQEELERLWYDGALFPDQRPSEEAA